MFRSRNSSNTSLRHEPLTNEQIRQLAPSVFAETPWQGMSHRYGFVPTSTVLDGMRNAGLVPVFAAQSRTRVEGKGDYTRHLLRFRPSGDLGLQVGDIFPELVLINSHDGTSCYELSAGLFRLVCLNGLCVADSVVQSLKARHTPSLVDDVIEASFTVLQDTPKAVAQVTDWRATELNRNASHALATAALQLRYEEDAPITPEQLLTPRRRDDVGSDLWTTFNRVQENLIRGGIQGGRAPRTGRRRSMRGVNAIQDDVKLNRALWTLATELHKAVA